MYVDRLKRDGVISSAPVERAFRQVPRHRFVPHQYYVREDGVFTPVDYDPDHPTPDQLDLLDSGRVIVTRVENGRSTSSCSDAGLVAQMLELLDLRPGMRVLEIGTGTGYNAALLAEITGDQTLVSTVDNQPEVVDQARQALRTTGYPDLRVRCADGFYGDRDLAPYDRIIAMVCV